MSSSTPPFKSHDKPTHIPSTYTLTTPPSRFPPSSAGAISNCTWHTLISAPETASSTMSCGIAVCPPKTGSLCPHRHAQAEIYHVLSGRGVVTIEGEEFVVGKGDTVFLPGGVEHGVRNGDEGEEELRWFYVFAVGGFGEVGYVFPGEEGYDCVGDGVQEENLSGVNVGQGKRGEEKTGEQTEERGVGLWGRVKIFWGF